MTNIRNTVRKSKKRKFEIKRKEQKLIFDFHILLNRNLNELIYIKNYGSTL